VQDSKETVPAGGIRGQSGAGVAVGIWELGAGSDGREWGPIDFVDCKSMGAQSKAPKSTRT